MDDLYQLLNTLITEVRQQPQPPNSIKWRLSMHRLLLEIQQLPRLAKSSHPDYPAALNLTLEYVRLNIAKFDLNSPSVSESFLKWINSYLGWRIRDLYSPEKDAPLSLDAPIASDFGEITLLDMGNTYYKTGQITEALDCLRAALQVFTPTNYPRRI
ncbi:MAG: tetratricopeptide repeat protein [Nostoc sp.]|uniref:tetratricopeptide repeat protein n=1 Tax=Nostoc sp. TaxID=1180 RepID=UPI002FF506A7